MKGYLILLLFVFTVSYAQGFNDKNDKKQQEISVKKLTKWELQNRTDDIFYATLLKNWNSNASFKECVPLPPLPWEWWKLDTLDTILISKKSIDSVIAISIAIKVATRCYGTGMIPIVAKRMGDNKEHWMVYIYNRHELQCMNPINAYNDGTLQFDIIAKSLFDDFGKEYDGCPLPIGVLISKKNGQVLFMGEL